MQAVAEEYEDDILWDKVEWCYSPAEIRAKDISPEDLGLPAPSLN